MRVDIVAHSLDRALIRRVLEDGEQEHARNGRDGGGGKPPGHHADPGQQEPSQEARRGREPGGDACEAVRSFDVSQAAKLIGDRSLGLVDLEPLDLLLDAVGDELLDAAVPGGLGRALGAVEQVRLRSSPSPRLSLPDSGSWSHVERTFFPTICGGTGKLNSARIEGARSTSDGDIAADRAIAEEHAGHLECVGTVVGRPGLVVGEQEFRGQLAADRRPRCAVAAVIADDQVRRKRRRVALVDLVRAIDAADHRLPVRVGDGLKPLDRSPSAGPRAGRPARRCRRARAPSCSGTAR